ncbi:MAG: hypothetical protein GY787_09430 [Alteromonadales bacterium]|nr:hypothetical protein [Alteromonadales bacterium]
MRVVLSIIIGALIVALFFVGFSYLIPSEDNVQKNIFSVQIDEELNYNKYEYIWNEQKSSIVGIQLFKGKPVLDVTTELSAQEDALIKSAYYDIDFTQIIPEAPLSTDGSWWYITNHGHSLKIRNPDSKAAERHLLKVSKLVRYIESFSELKKYGKTNT